jgi:hypothetical protein
LSCLLSAIIFPKEAVNFTISIAVSDSPGTPPIVPLIPDMLLISATVVFYSGFLDGKNKALQVKGFNLKIGCRLTFVKIG